jgi:hypothetical protein
VNSFIGICEFLWDVIDMHRSLEGKEGGDGHFVRFS